MCLATLLTVEGRALVPSSAAGLGVDVRAAFGFVLGDDWVVVLSVAWGVVTLLTVEGRALVAAALVVGVVFVAVVVAVAFGFVLGFDWVVVLSIAWGVVLGVGLEVGLVDALGGGFEAAEEGAFLCLLCFRLEAAVVGAECGLGPNPEADADFGVVSLVGASGWKGG